jgi:hypothetical protein
MEKIQEIFIGHIVMKSNFSGSKSDGFLAYIFTDNLKNYKLAREGIYGPKDEFFYVHNKKYVEVSGYLFKDKILMVSEINEIKDPFDNNLFQGNAVE